MLLPVNCCDVNPKHTVRVRLASITCIRRYTCLARGSVPRADWVLGLLDHVVDPDIWMRAAALLGVVSTFDATESFVDGCQGC